MKKILIILLLSGCSGAFAQSLAPLSIEKIMRDPKWIGIAPSNIRWSDDSKKIYFNWNPENTDRDQLFAITPTDIKPTKVSLDDRKAMVPEFGDWNKKHTLKVFEKNGDVFLSDLVTGKITQLTNTAEREGSPLNFSRWVMMECLAITGCPLMIAARPLSVRFPLA